MATKATLQVLARDTAGKNITTNILYVSPNASDMQLKELAQKLNDLTTNTFRGAQKVVTTDITAASYEYTISTASSEIQLNPDGTVTFDLITNIPSTVDVTWQVVTDPTDVETTINRIGDSTGFKVSVYADIGAESGQYPVAIRATLNGTLIAEPLNVTYKV